MSESAKAATMEEFKQTPYYQGLGVEGLEAQLAGYQADDEALRTQAEAEYRPAYESEVEAARQALEKEVQGYNAQLAGTGAAYDRQRRSTNQAYEESAAEMNSQLTKRGLGRSSLVATQGTYLQNQRNQALSEIDRAESDAINAINEKIALLTEQAAQSEKTMAGNYARQLESRISELREKNRSASISLQLQIAALQQQGYEAYQDWLLANRKQEVAEKEFEAEYGGMISEESSGGSSSGGSASKGQTGTAQASGKSTGTISEKASSAASALTEATKKLVRSLASGVKAAAAAQKQAAKTGAGSSAAQLTGKAGQKSIRQNVKE